MPAYFDHNAGAPLHPLAEEAMAEAVAQLRLGGNPSAQHGHGRALRRILDRARERVGALLDADPGTLEFTSGATEGAALVLDSGWDLVVQSGIEHVGVREAVRGESVSLRVRRDGVADLSSLEEILKASGGRALVAMLAASNETGVLQPVEKAARIARDAGAAFLCDATQMLGRERFSCRSLGDAYVVASAHKIGGPPGTGVLADSRGHRAGLRRHGGTDNVVGIAGMGGAAAATEQAPKPSPEHRDAFEDRLRSGVRGVRFYGAESPRLPGTSCFSMPGWDAATLVIGLDLEGFSVGAGAACASGRNEPAWAPQAMGFGEEAGRGALRVSAGAGASREDWERLATSLVALAAQRQAA